MIKMTKTQAEAVLGGQPTIYQWTYLRKLSYLNCEYTRYRVLTDKHGQPTGDMRYSGQEVNRCLGNIKVWTGTALPS